LAPFVIMKELPFVHPNKNKDWDNGQPDHTCDWNRCTMYAFVPCLQFFCIFKPITHVCTLKMAEDELNAYSASSLSMSWDMQ
jgi:hypothetical protein